MKRSVQLQPFSHDHYQGLHVFRRLEAGLDVDADVATMAAYVLEVWDTHLAEHFEQEEAVLIGPLERSHGEHLAQQMVAEHRALHTATEALRSGSGDRDTITWFTQNLHDHIRFEDRVLFPYLERQLDPSDLDIVGEQLRALHGGSATEWPIPPWEQESASPTND